ARLHLGVERADRGVERREELVLDVDVASGERPHQGGLAGVRVPHESDAPGLAAVRAAHVLVTLDGRELFAELGDPVADLATVELDGGISGPAAALPLLARRRLTHPRRHVRQARDLDLQPSLTALRVPMEDVDDDASAVEHRRAGGALEVTRLAGREIVVDGDQIDLRSGRVAGVT